MTPNLRRLLIPLLSTLVMLGILISLGTWQLHRLAWKTDLLGQIDRAEQLPAIPMPDQPTQFQKVRLEGQFLSDTQGFYAAELRDGVLGAQLIVPVLRPGKPTVLVDLGWVPDNAPRPIPIAPGPVDGFIRDAETAGPFSAKDNPATHRFYTLDPAAIGAGLGQSNVAPYVLFAIGPSVAGQYPSPATALPRPPNDHLQYALTWFGFAVTLVIIFLLYARKVLTT